MSEPKRSFREATARSRRDRVPDRPAPAASRRPYACPVRGVFRQRRWIGFTVFILAMLVVCVLLSRWQWHRYHQRLAENDRLDAALSAPAVPVDELISAAPAGADAAPLPDELEWRTVTATGTFDTANEVAVRRRPMDGRNGYWIVTPLDTDTGVLLVNRGWTPALGDATATPEATPAPTGTVTVTGRLRPAESTQQTDAAPTGQAWAADPQALVAPAETPRYDAYLELTGTDPASESGLTALETPGHRGLNNLVYSGQWLLFALVGLFGWWQLIRQESRREDQASRPREPVTDGTAREG